MAFGNVGALLHLAPNPFDDGRLSAMCEALRMTGAQETAYYVRRGGTNGPSVALLHSTIRTVNEDTAPTAAALDTASHSVVADARLDNRDELLSVLGDQGLDSTSPDTALILGAYRRWGRDCARRLRGDFAFIVWDAVERRLLAARDIFGVRALLYSQAGARVVVASTMRGALAGLERRPPYNRRHLRDFIAGSPQSFPVETPYSSVNRLAPGHLLEIHDDRLTVRRYDALRPAALSVRREEDAWDQFGALLARSVERRLRSSGPIGFLVSGGLDSSSVLCLAQRARRLGLRIAPLRSYSAIFERNARADEREYLDAVLARCPDVTATRVLWDERPWNLDALIGADGFPMDEPPESSRFFGVVLAQMAVADGCRVILQGLWADQLLIRQPYAFGELLWDLPFRRIMREWWHFVHQSWRGATKGAGKALLRHALRGTALIGVNAAPNSALHDLLRSRFVWGQHAATMNYVDRLARFIGAEVRYPFLDRELHEFMLALPTEYLFRDLERKRLLRGAAADLLPPSFQARTTFGAITHLFIEGVNRDAHRIRAMLRDSLSVQEGLASARHVARALSVLGPKMQATRILDIQRLVAVEAWLRRNAGLD